MNEQDPCVENDNHCSTWPLVSEQTIEHVVSLIRRGRTSFDVDTFEDFERDLARLFGVRYALCCSSGTSAAFSVWKALGIGPGDTVIAPAFTHWATVLPAVQCGARIAFADVEPDSSTMDVASVRALVDDTTRAVVVTHVWGTPGRIEALRALCDERGLTLVEDVSHAHGAMTSAGPAGSIGHAAFCSFQAQKLVSGGECGALLTGSEELLYRAMEWGNEARLARVPFEWQRLHGVGRGFKFRPSPILVALAHGSLRELRNQNEIRARACGDLRRLLSTTKPFARAWPVTNGRVYFKNDLVIARPAGTSYRDDLAVSLRRRGIQLTSKMYPFLPEHPALAGHVAPSGPWPEAHSTMARLLLLAPFTRYDAASVQLHAAIMSQEAERFWTFT
jgi:dTDP-4-amino-4,6-dideoxygalactose transaminase